MEEDYLLYRYTVYTVNLCPVLIILNSDNNQQYDIKSIILLLNNNFMPVDVY